MNDLTERIKTMLEFEDVSVAKDTYESTIGTLMNRYNVNKGGVVHQFGIQAEEDDEGIIEDFLEYIEATVLEATV